VLDPQMKRGLLENCVLATLARGDSYGYQIIKDLSHCVLISESTLYPILRRLENAGSVSEYSVEHNGRLRKFYRISPQGRKQLSEFLLDWDEITAMHDYIKEGMSHE